MITVQLLGGACLRSGDIPLSGPPAQRHRIALLALIAAAYPQPLTRDRAMAMLWPEKDVASARRLLNLAVHVLRAALGEAAINSTGDGLLLSPSHIDCDLHELRQAIEADASERVVRLYTAPLLDGFHLDDSSEFGYWLDERRSELSHAYAGALLALADRQERTGDHHARVRTCMRLVAADPHSSRYAQALMRAFDEAGDRHSALQHASEYTRRRRADLDLGPDPGVDALAVVLRTAPPRKAIPVVDAESAAQSVAVLPFVSLSTDTRSEYFADGLTDDVIAHLSKIHALRVIARTSVMPFKQRHFSIREIGETLRATTILDGTIRYADNRVRIVAHLIDVRTERHLWSETYDRQMTDIFSIQTDVALRIAGALNAELSREEESRVLRPHTQNIHAYRHYQQGKAWYVKYNPEAYLRAIHYFDRAISLDPTFALAYAMRGMVYVELAESGHMTPGISFSAATESSQRAFDLDPELGEAHCVLGYLKGVRDHDWVAAEHEFKRALDLSPSSADTYDLYGRLLAGIGRYDDAIHLQRRARELDPVAHRLDIVTTLLRAGRYEDALAEAREAVEFDPGYDRGRATLGWALFFSGEKALGIAELERASLIGTGNTLWLGQLGEAYGLAGDRSRALEILTNLEERAKTAFVSPYHFAYVYTGLGEHAQAIEFLERAIETRTGPTYGIKGSFLLAPLREHPGFRELLGRMNLA